MRRRGGSRTAPTCQHQYPVQMIRHDTPFVQGDEWVLRRQPLPGLGHYAADSVQTHLSVDDLTKHVHPAVRAHGHEIRAVGRIIPPGQSNAAAVMDTRIVRHCVRSIRPEEGSTKVSEPTARV